jgi:carboxypeptidase C (cathepsin A)
MAGSERGAVRAWARVPALWALLVLHACGGDGGGGGSPAITPPSAPGDAPLSDGNAYSTDAAASLATPNESFALTHHSIVLGGSAVAYSARAGHLTALQAVSGAPQASFFHVDYTMDGADPAMRPVTFFYNGGPGSATVWLHLGSFGPKRLSTGEPSAGAPRPFPLVDNNESLLDVSDLVFVDAVGTGLSQAVTPNTNQAFWSVDADAAVFRDFVMRWLEVNNRQASPLVLFGESYGTTRSAVLVHALETAGVRVDGVVLQSSILDYNSNCSVVGVDKGGCAGYLPSYGAAGAWYSLVKPPGDLPGYMMLMRAYATQTYGPAVNAFLTQGAAFDSTLPTQLQTLTGMAASTWQAHFNLGPDTFQADLLPGQLIGRYDARMSAATNDPLSRDGDPSGTFVTPSFQIAIASYLRDQLGYVNASTYVLLSNAIDTWDFGHDGLALPDTVPDLAAARVLNPRLKVLSLNGYHDLATPFFQTENDLARLGASPDIELHDYAGGHMTYLDDAARPQEKADLLAFYQRVVAEH